MRGLQLTVSTLPPFKSVVHDVHILMKLIKA